MGGPSPGSSDKTNGNRTNGNRTNGNGSANGPNKTTTNTNVNGNVNGTNKTTTKTNNAANGANRTTTSSVNGANNANMNGSANGANGANAANRSYTTPKSSSSSDARTINSNRTNTPHKPTQQSQQSQQQTLPPSPSNNSPPSATTTSSAAPQQKKIERRLWNITEWFGSGDEWHFDFAKWIILVLEEREDSEKKNIEAGLNVMRREIEEIFNAGMIDPDSYKSCISLITKCRDVRTNYDNNQRDELLNTIFDHLKMEFDKANSLIETLASMSVEQRIILRFMTHQKIQARVAFLRTTLKTHKTTYEMERYHCITNPYYGEIHRQKQAASEECKELRANINDLSYKFNDLNNNFKEVNEEVKVNNELNKELTQENTRLKEQLTKKENEARGFIEGYSRVSQERDKMKVDIKQFRDKYDADIKQLRDEAEELHKQVKSAKDEATKYQAALGSATNIRWSDSTLNNPIQLTKDIEKFQHSLIDFTKVKGKSFQVDEDSAKQLLASYDCKANLTNTREIKNYLTGALQRMILETIFENADNLYYMAKHNQECSDGYLEPYIVYYNHHLGECINTLVASREGQDSVTAITPVKIRQQVYAALGSRGFAKSRHPIIKRLVNDIFGNMETYREVVDEEKKKELHSDAEKIIRSGMQLWFCLKAQEPMPETRWFKPGAPIEPHLMVGSWENENVKDLEVDFTIFPLIITEQDGQVFSKAQVFARPKKYRLSNLLN